MRFLAQRFQPTAVRMPLAKRDPRRDCSAPLCLHTRAVPSLSLAAVASTSLAPKRVVSGAAASSCLRRPQPSSSTRRAFSSSSSSPSSPFPPPPASNPDTAPEPNESDAPADATDPPPRLHVPPEESIYKLAFTCRPCGSRSFHRISGQGYHKGTVLVTCPQCRSRHIISDHLCIFTSSPETVESLLKEKGEKVHKVLAYQSTRSIEEVMAEADAPLKTAFEGGNDDIEFLEDGSVRASHHIDRREMK